MQSKHLQQKNLQNSNSKHTDSKSCSANSVNVASVGKKSVMFLRSSSSISFFCALRMNSRPFKRSDVSINERKCNSSHGIKMLADFEFFLRPKPLQHCCVTDIVFFLPLSSTLQSGEKGTHFYKHLFIYLARC